MSRRRDERPRVLGPTWYDSLGYFRVMVITPEAEDPKERKKSFHYRDQAEAEEEAEKFRRLIEQSTTRTLEDTITGYAQHLQDKGTTGWEETIRRLRLFFREPQLALGRYTPARGKDDYTAFRARAKKNGETISVSYHRATLINARSMFTWCIDEGWFTGANPLARVKGLGKRESGKDSLTGDELKKFFAHVMPKAEAGDRAALGVLVVLSMALRSSDVTKRVVRDVDLDGTQLIIKRGKSKASNITRVIPDDLQPLIRELVAGRDALEPLFRTPYTESGHHTRRWLEEAMRRFCKGAGVPCVCPHSLKGAAGEVLAVKGERANVIMQHLSHEESSTTFRHYVDRGQVESAQAGQLFKVISGGKR